MFENKKAVFSVISLYALTPFVFAESALPENVPAIVAPAQETQRYTTTQEMKVETRLTAFMLEKAHILKKKVSALDMNELIVTNCSTLDSTHSIFLQSDIDEFKLRFGLQLADYLERGSLHTAFTIYNKFLKRLDERIARIDSRLASPETFNLNRSDSLKTDRKDEKWPADINAADELWEKRLTSEIITELLSEDKTQEKDGDAADISDAANISPERVAEACKKIRERYSKLRENLTLEPWEVQEIFLNSLTSLYDPHTTFFSKQSMEEFEIMMRNSLCGIGAVLYMDDGYCTIREVMPGSPVERSGKIAVGDRIVAVGASGDASAALTDVVGMRLNRIVRMLRGEKGKPVCLLIESGSDHSRQLITLERDEIKLTEQLATAKIIDVAHGEKTIPVGVITLPSFYGKDRSDNSSFSTSEDVKELLGKLKDSNVKALILDLRRNGGGYLNEAIDLLELFVGPGVPAVRTRDAGGRIQTLSTGGALGVAKSLFISKPEWTGPVIVLVSKLSASASEIVAGALQDTRRALIVGDPNTHGKGSVQEVIPFKAYEPSQEASIKLTRSKWYSPSGNSIQVKGVPADIVTPSVYSVLPVAESDLERPLPWDKVPSVINYKNNESWAAASISPELVKILSESSARRQAELPEFLTLNRTISWLDEREKDSTIPLSITERLSRRDDDKDFYELVKKEYTTLKAETDFKQTEVKLDSAIAQEKESAENTEKKADRPEAEGANNLLYSITGGDADADWPEYDVLLREAARIAADWVENIEKRSLVNTAAE